MATMIIAGETYQMPVWLKARLLEVRETEFVGVLEVESGTERGVWHKVRHNGKTALSCDCRATVPQCAHKLAAERYLVSVEVLGAELAQDLTQHIEDEMASHPEEYGELAAEAEAIVERERKHNAAMKRPLPRINTSKYALSTPNYREHHEVCQCGADDWQQHYKLEYEAYKAAEKRKQAPLNGNQGFSLMRV